MTEQLASGGLMTWVIGASSEPPIALLLADVRMMIDHRVPADVLQKVHQINPSIVVGFAGDVRAGFRLVQQLKWWIGHLGQKERLHVFNLLEQMGPQLR